MFYSPSIPTNLNSVVQDCCKVYVGDFDTLLIAPETFGELHLYVTEFGRMAVKYDWQTDDLFGDRYTTLCFHAWRNQCHLATGYRTGLEGTELALRLMQFHVLMLNGCNENSRAINKVLNIAVLQQELHYVNTRERIPNPRQFVIERLLKPLQDA